MPITCANKRDRGMNHCRDRCSVISEEGLFEIIEIGPDRSIPDPDPSAVDVAVLDMHHGWPSLGYDSILFAFRDAVCDVGPVLRRAGLRLRVHCFDVRRSLAVPEPDPSRFRLFVGSGGPGHFDPKLNDGADPVSQGIRESTEWTAPYRRLLDQIVADDRIAYIAICHSFGLLCEHLGVARGALRGPEKGGKSAGVVDVALQPKASAHPWFGRLEKLFTSGRIPALDSRFYDLLPINGAASASGPFLGIETLGRNGRLGDAATLAEFARDSAGIVPRVMGTNFHPEIVPGPRARLVLEEKYAAGRTSIEWYEERLKMIMEVARTPGETEALHAVSDFTFLGPLRYHLYKQLRDRLDSLSIAEHGVDESSVFERLPTAVDPSYETAVHRASSSLSGGSRPEA